MPAITRSTVSPAASRPARGWHLVPPLAGLLLLGTTSLGLLAVTALLLPAQPPASGRAPANAGTAPAQTSARANAADTLTLAPRWHMAYTTLGVTRIGSGALNRQFAAAGLPSLPSDAAMLGGGASVMLGRWIVGGQGHALVVGPDIAGGRRLRTAGGYGLVDLGVVAHASPRTRLSLIVGGGAGKLDLRVRDTARTSFDSLAQSPRRGVDVSAHTPLWHVGTSFEHALGTRTRGALVLGLRAGYVGRVGRSEWRTDGDPLDGGPSAMAHGPYVRLVVGSVLPNRRSAILPALGTAVRWLVP
jgi:hypothetical protein